jgi:predicted nucleic acid-binding protein
MTVLIDSNVIIAHLDMDHRQHHASRAVFMALDDAQIMLASHSLSEVYNKMTRGLTTEAFAPKQTALVLRHLAQRVTVRALTFAETLNAIQAFAGIGGRGARLYDFLIGQVAILEGVRELVTWNTKDFAPLFPDLRIVTPAEFTGAA